MQNTCAKKAPAFTNSGYALSFTIQGCYNQPIAFQTSESINIVNKKYLLCYKIGLHLAEELHYGDHCLAHTCNIKKVNANVRVYILHEVIW